jgi:hypothetical protein
MITLDDGHEIFSKYFFVEAVILLTVFFTGLRVTWARMLYVLLGLVEVWFFYEGIPISPDDLPMILIFGLRLYVLVLSIRERAD